MKMVALIPARAGSKRIPGKNMKLLAGHPLLYWTILAAYESNVFADICVVTEDDATARFAMQVANVRVMSRSAATATDDAPDILWVREFFEHNNGGDTFAILRPTSPFRTAETIRRAYDTFARTPDVDSMRAVQPVKEHPGKMWEWRGSGHPMTPVIGGHVTPVPWHSSPTQSLPKFYVQNASLEMAWIRTVTQLGSIAGKKVLPFFTEWYEGFDLNTLMDWDEAERLIKDGFVTLPTLARV